MLENENIICLAPMDWSDNPVSNTHLMSRVAKKNKVLYVETIGNRVPTLRDAKRILIRLKNWMRGTRTVESHLAPSNVYVYSPLVIPLHNVSIVRKINHIFLVSRLRKLVKKLNLERPILWFYAPRLVKLIGQFEEKCVVYHCVDELSTYKDADNTLFAAMEEELLRKADIVLTPARSLFERKQKYNTNIHLMPNAADIEHISKSRLETTPVAPDIANIKKPIIGYVGTIANWVDLLLIEKIAVTHPEWSIVLIGHIHAFVSLADIKKLEIYKNIHLLGRKEYEELPRYYKAFDACIVPLLLNEHIMYSNPTKIYEYLATGKPIVSTDFPSAREFEHLIRIAKNREDFIHQIEKALNEDEPQFVEARLEEAKKHSWDARVEKISELIIQALNR
ncbi:glycosyltransferase [bacterium]|nr:glycosyltransferase [bacterium]